MPTHFEIINQLTQHLIIKKELSLLVTDNEGEALIHGTGYNTDIDYPVIHIQELAPLTDFFDRILVKTDGFNFQIYVILDSTLKNQNATIEKSKLIEIGKSCLHLTGQIYGNKLPVAITVVEIVDGARPKSENLIHLKNKSFKDKVVISCFQLDFRSQTVLTNTPLNGWLAGRFFFQSTLRDIARNKPLPNQSSIFNSYVTEIPYVTFGLIFTFTAIFLFLLWKSGRYFSPSQEILIQYGALNPNLVLMDQNWYRLVTAPFLHANILHLMMNLVSLFFSGRLLEKLIGKTWILTLFVLSALSGSFFSLFLNPQEVLSVGASGGIMGLIVALFTISFLMPYGHFKSQVQIQSVYFLVPNLMAVLTHKTEDKIDYAAHLGGAVLGALFALILSYLWQKKSLNRWKLILVSFCLFTMSAAIANMLHSKPPTTVVANNPKRIPEIELSVILEKNETLENSLKLYDELATRYSEDPMGYYLLAVNTYQLNKFEVTINLLIEALTKEELLKNDYASQDLESNIRYLLAKSFLNTNQINEARYAIYDQCAQDQYTSNIWLTEDEFVQICK